jgi:hypothetical protein
LELFGDLLRFLEIKVEFGDNLQTLQTHFCISLKRLFSPTFQGQNASFLQQKRSETLILMVEKMSLEIISKLAKLISNLGC